jgi:hypothetical protein
MKGGKKKFFPKKEKKLCKFNVLDSGIDILSYRAGGFPCGLKVLHRDL